MNLYVILLLIYLHLVNGQEMYGTEGVLTVKDIQTCKVDNPNAIDLIETRVKLAEVNGEKVLNAKVSLKTEFDDNFTFKAVVNVNNGMKFEFAGVLCQEIHNFLPDLWKKVSDILSIGPDCPIPPGDYELNNFIISSNETGLPFVLYGDLNIQVTVYLDNKMITCTEFDIMSKDE